MERPSSIVVGATFSRLQVVPGIGDPTHKCRALSARVAVRMKPTQQQCHVPAQLIGGRVRRDAERTIAIGIGMQQDLFNIKTRSGHSSLLRYVHRAERLGKHAIIASHNSKQDF